MKLLLLEPDAEFGRIIRDLLGKSRFQVQHVQSVSEAKAIFQQCVFDLALFSVPAQTQEIEALLSDVRSHPAGTTLPIVLISDVWVESDPKMTHMVRVQNCQGFLARPFPLLDLPDMLQTAAQDRPKEKSADLEAANKKPDHGALVLFKEIWSEQKTGVLRLESSEDWALFIQGCTVDPTATALARKGLYEGGVEFRETNQSGSKDPDFHLLLWEALLTTAKTTFLLQREKIWAAPESNYGRISEFPLTDKARDLVSDSKKTVPLADLLEDDLTVAPELAALAALNIIEFQPTEIPVASKPVKAKASTPVAAPEHTKPDVEPSLPSTPPMSDDTPSTPPIRGGQVASDGGSAGVVFKRLRREWDALADADHYTVLGASPNTDPELLEALASRMSLRYTAILQDEDQPEPVRDLARKILARVHEAENLVVGRKRVQSPQPAEDPETLSKEDLYFREGQTAMESGLYTRAIQCFTAARNERLDSARNLSWLGWAVYQNEEQPLKDRCSEALDFLRLASSFDPHHREGQYFLAFIESKHGLPEQALRRLQGLVQDDPGNTLARTLLNNVRREVGSS